MVFKCISLYPSDRPADCRLAAATAQHHEKYAASPGKLKMGVQFLLNGITFTHIK